MINQGLIHTYVHIFSRIETGGFAGFRMLGRQNLINESDICTYNNLVNKCQLTDIEDIYHIKQCRREQRELMPQSQKIFWIQVKYVIGYIILVEIQWFSTDPNRSCILTRSFTKPNFQMSRTSSNNQNFNQNFNLFSFRFLGYQRPESSLGISLALSILFLVLPTFNKHWSNLFRILKLRIFWVSSFADFVSGIRLYFGTILAIQAELNSC